jgi:NitT/TauT family transport system permease protein
MTPIVPLDGPLPRRDFEREPIDASDIGDVERPLNLLEQFASHDAIRRAAIILVLGLIWELYARSIDNPLILPTLGATLTTFFGDLASGVLVDRVATSLRSLLLGYLAGLSLAAVFTTIAVSTRLGSDLLSTLTAMFNPVPAIALLPLALIWFGLGTPSLVFVIVHSVLWAVALNTLTGFRSVPETLRMSGRNYGLRGVKYVALVLVPAAFPSILTGLKIGWAFAWRTLIAAELVFGVSSRSGGLGWYIFEARAELETSRVFAGLLAIVLIGLAVEAVIFRFIEARTVLRWGMQR